MSLSGHTPSAPPSRKPPLPRMEERRQAVTVAGLSMRLYILPPDSTSCWPCLLLFPLAWSPGSCDLFQLGQQAGEDVCV